MAKTPAKAKAASARAPGVLHKMLRKDGKGGMGWYWHIIRGGRIIADGGEPYARTDGINRAIRTLTKILTSGQLKIVNDHPAVGRSAKAAAKKLARKK